ncbi:hypothetical protein D3OALGA1CA_3895 [Olavius algarvensis associated proteobacterium Delta 3]|nr:hypothetical protein D3OALGA1CA_3895 [Olavius algarvensis associated proteobacterium Delta 3]
MPESRSNPNIVGVLLNLTAGTVCWGEALAKTNAPPYKSKTSNEM